MDNYDNIPKLEIEKDPEIIKASKISLIIWIAMFFLIASFILLFIQQFYIIFAQIPKDVLLDKNHPNYSLYTGKVNNFTNSFGQLIVYFITTTLTVYLMRKAIWKDLKALNKKCIGWIISTVALGYLFFMCANLFSQIIMVIFNVTSEAGNEQAINDLMSSGVANFLFMSVATVFFAPILEEIVFRKAVFNLLGDRFHPYLIVLISGLIFGAIHIINPVLEAVINFANNEGSLKTIVEQFAYLFVYGGMGVALSLTYHVSKRNIVPCIILHMINNLISTIFTISQIYLMFEI